RPDLRARAPHEESHRFARIAKREEEEARAAIFVRLCIAHHRSLAVIDLAFFSGRGDDDRARLDRSVFAQRGDKAADTRVARGEAVIIDEVLPDRHRIATAAHRLEDQRAIRLARARARRAAGWRRAWGRGVGGHLHRGGRIWRWPHGRPSAGAPHRDAGRPQIGARRLAADARCRFDAAQRPPEAAEREDCCRLDSLKTLLMSGEGPSRPRRRQRLGLAIAGGRFSGVHQWPVLGVHRGARLAYSALGALVDGATIPGDSADEYNGEEEFYVNDALGNRHASWQLNTHNGVFTDSAHTSRIWFYHAGTAREDSADIFPSGLVPLPVNQTVMGWFDGAGDAYAYLAQRGTSSAAVLQSAVSFFDAAGRLRVYDKRSCSATPPNGAGNVCHFANAVDASNKGYFDEYHYDALGRRVLLRSRSDSTCPATSNQCVSVIQRTVYDGDQVLYELQEPGADSIPLAQLERDTTSTYQLNLPFGRVAYTHGVDLDKPLDVIRVGYDSIWPGPEAVIPHTNWQGVEDVGSWDDGRESRCASYAPG